MLLRPGRGRSRPAVAWSWLRRWSLPRLCGHLVQHPQQPEPAGETDLRPLTGAGSPAGIADDPKTARWRLGPVQDYADLHKPTVPALVARNIGQLADGCPAGAAPSLSVLTRCQHRSRHAEPANLHPDVAPPEGDRP